MSLRLIESQQARTTSPIFRSPSSAQATRTRAADRRSNNDVHLITALRPATTDGSPSIGRRLRRPAPYECRSLRDYPAGRSHRRVETQTSKAIFHPTNISSVAFISGGRAKEAVN